MCGNWTEPILYTWIYNTGGRNLRALTFESTYNFTQSRIVLTVDFYIEWFWLPIFRTNLVRCLSNKEMKFQKKWAIPIQIAPLLISQPHNENQSIAGYFVHSHYWHYLCLQRTSNTTQHQFVLDITLRCWALPTHTRLTLLTFLTIATYGANQIGNSIWLNFASDRTWFHMNEHFSHTPDRHYSYSLHYLHAQHSHTTTQDPIVLDLTWHCSTIRALAHIFSTQKADHYSHYLHTIT